MQIFRGFIQCKLIYFIENNHETDKWAPWHKIIKIKNFLQIIASTEHFSVLYRLYKTMISLLEWKGRNLERKKKN